jgi:hypothetical protein
MQSYKILFTRKEKRVQQLSKRVKAMKEGNGENIGRNSGRLDAKNLFQKMIASTTKKRKRKATAKREKREETNKVFKKCVRIQPHTVSIQGKTRRIATK